MNKILFILIISISLKIGAQETSMFSVKEKSNLIELSPKLNNYQFNETNFNSDLKELLNFDKKRRQNKTWAFVFTGIGLASAGISAALFNKDQPIADVVGAITTASSVISFGASVPFYLGHFKNKKRKKKKLIFINNKLERPQAPKN